MARSRGFKERFGATALAGAVLCVCIIFASPIAPSVRALKENIFAPHSADIELSLLSKDALMARVQNDERLLGNVKYESVLYGLLADENTSLRVAANAARTADTVTARVLSRPPYTLYDTLLIDQGTGSGIAVGDLAVFHSNALGRVASAGEHSAVVQLFSSPGSETDAVLGTPAAIAVAKGKGGGTFELSIPQGITVAAGDSVRVPASASLLLGIVGGVVAEPTDASQTVYVHAVESYADLDFIEIIPAHP